MIKQSGQSVLFGDEFVIIRVGRKSGRVKYIVILTWPMTSTADERTSDRRMISDYDSGTESERLILLPSGVYEPVRTDGTVYLLRGSELLRMQISMKESQMPWMDRNTFPDVMGLWHHLRRFAAPPDVA